MSRATVVGLLMGLAVLVTLPSQGQQSITMQEQVEAFVTAFNSGDASTMIRFYERTFTTEFRARRSNEERRSMYLNMFADMGPLEVQQLKIEEPGTVTVRAASKRSGIVQLSFEFEPQLPHRIASVGISLGGPGPEMDLPPVPQLQNLTVEEWRQAVDLYLRDLAATGVFAGSVLIASDDEVLHRGAYGLANREHEVANDLNTRFDIGSITKLFTKTAIGQLARDGKLGLDDTIADHLPSYPNQSVASKVTINQLLRHTSGLGDIFTEEFFRGSKTRFRAPEDFFELFVDMPLLFEPGERRKYSNAGYVVLGAIAAAAGGLPYEEYLARNIFAPAGMTSPLFPAKDLPTTDVAIGYTTRGADESGGEWRTNTFLTPIQGCPAGGLATTADDLWRFDRALRKTELLGPGWTGWMFSDLVPDAADLVGEPQLADRGWAIAGGAPGVNAVVESDGSVAVVVLANLDPPIAMALGKKLREAVMH